AIRANAATTCSDPRDHSVRSTGPFAPPPIGECHEGNARRAARPWRNVDRRSSHQPGRCVCQLSGRQPANGAAAAVGPGSRTRRRCPMMTVFFKELRENLKWAAVICGVLLMFVVHEIRDTG